MPEIVFSGSMNSGLREAIDLIGPTIDADDHLYRSMTQVKNRDLSPITQERMQEIALMLFRINPLAHRILKLSCGFISSGAVTFNAEDKSVQKVLEEHWNHPMNDWDNQLYQRVFELSLYGEQCYTVATGSRGQVILGYISPLEIKEVRPWRFNSSRPGAIVLKKEAGSREEKIIDVIQYNPVTEYREGECFFFGVNRVTDSMRGTSDLLPLADYLDNLDQLLFSLIERVAHGNSYIWDVKMTGATEDKIKAFLAELQANPPQPGGVRAHNDLVEWTAVSPDLKADDNSEHVRLFRNHILGGAGLAEWMFADSGGTGRATASEMAEPTYKSLITRQREIRGFLGNIFDFCIDQAIQMGEVSPNVNRKFSISLPKISLRDFQRTAGALYRTAQAIEVMLNNGLIDREKGVKLASSLIDQLDLESDVAIDVPDMKDVPSVQIARMMSDATKPDDSAKPTDAKPAKSKRNSKPN